MYLNGLGIYYLKNGQPVDTLYVGDVMTFNVPGYSQIWLDQYQNGQLQFSGPFNLPMPPYTLQTRDVGTFTASIYKLVNGQKGDNIGTDRVTVLASAPVQVQTLYAPPTVIGQGAPSYVPGAVSSSEARTISTGVPTASAPPTIVVQSPSGPLDLGPALRETPVPPSEIQQAGFSWLPLLLIAGAGLYFAFGGSRK